MKEKQFRQIFIEGKEENLPKETGYYIVWTNNSMNLMSIRWYIEHNKSEWNNVVSYLLPLSEPVMPTKDEKLKNHFVEEEYFLEHWLAQALLTPLGLRLKMAKRLKWVQSQLLSQETNK